jgi:predicted SnoaL-like aldol condensation-catalyzing enzyme
MAPSRKQQVIDLLKSLETNDPVPLAYVNPNKYIQHNLQVGPGPAGVAALIKNMPPDASVNTIRVFEDGDYVFAHTQYGPTIASDLDKTDANKALMQRYMEDLLVGRRETFPRYFNGTLTAKGQAVVYKTVHTILGEGNFVLVVAEATFGGVPTGIYNLFRIENGRIAEHWDKLEAIPPRDQWKNSNGKF